MSAPPWPVAHLALAVPDLEAATASLIRLLGAEAGPVRENAAQGVRLRHLTLPNLTLELLSPLGEGGPVARFLDRHPRGGLHHLALAVPDLDAASTAVAATGARTLPPGTSVDGARIAFVLPDATTGLLIELEEHPPG